VSARARPYLRAAKACAPFLMLFAAALVFFRKVLFGDHYLIPFDFRYFHLPLATAIRDAIASGNSPLWDPSTYCGRPLFADPQAQLYYLPTTAAIGLSVLWPSASLAYLLEWQLVLHVFAAGALAFAMLRRMNISTPAALCGGAIFELGGFFASQTQHLGAVDAAAWIPLMWTAVWELRSRWHGGWFAALAMAGATSVLAGFPPVSNMALVSTFLLAVTLWLCREGTVAQLGRVSAAFVMAAGLAAVLIIPAAQLTSLSVAKYRSDWLDGGGLPPQSLVSLLWPNHYNIFDLRVYSGPWNPTFLYLYCGFGGLALALYCIYRRHAPPLVILTLLSALYMFGDLTPLGWAAFKFTPKLLRGSFYPHYAMATFCLGMAALAAIGLDRIGRLGTIGKYAVAGAIAIDLIAAGSGRPMNTADALVEPGYTSEQVDGSPRLPAELRRLTGETNPPARIDTFEGSEMWSTTAPLTRIPTANGYNPMALEKLMQVRLSFAKGERWGAWYEIENLDSPIVNMLGVKYVLSRHPISSPKVVKIGEYPGTLIYENQSALPRFHLVHEVRAVQTMEQAIGEIRRPDFDPSRRAVVETAAPLAAGSAAGDSVETQRYQPGAVDLKLHAAAAGYLVSSEAFYPGWRAFIDGVEAPVRITDGAFIGIAAPPGDHTVALRFSPRIAWISAAISLLSLLVMATVSRLRY
jgi:hypothetical protein